MKTSTSARKRRKPRWSAVDHVARAAQRSALDESLADARIRVLQPDGSVIRPGSVEIHGSGHEPTAGREPLLLTEARTRVRETSIDKGSAADAVVSRGFDLEILTRIAAPVVAGLAVVVVMSRSLSVMALVIFVAAFIVLDVAALTMGHDSRDGLDWRRGHVDRVVAPPV